MSKLGQRMRTEVERRPRLHRTASRLKKNRRPLLAALVVIAHVMGFLTSVKAIMEVRTSQGAIAWAVSLNTIPYVAVPAYWVFGQDEFNGYVLARQAKHQRTSPIAAKLMADLQEKNLIAPREENRLMTTEKLVDLPFTAGNAADLLIDGEEIFESIFSGISRAEKYILVQFYILRDDHVGQELKKRLIERSAAGVRCLVLYDEFGSAGLPKAYSAELKRHGIEIHPFNTTQGPTNRFQLNFRNHRKSVVVDGHESWVGGINIGKEYLGEDPKVGYWRDTHIHLRGPVTKGVQVSFLEDWHWATDEFLTDLDWEPIGVESGSTVNAICVPTGPADPMETCTLMVLHAINSATEKLWIATPYFVPDEQFISALQLAATRGVDVRILIPEETDSFLPQLSAWSYVTKLETAGVKMFRYTKGFLHQKVMLIDDTHATVGTANFDNRSFRLNFEMTILVEDQKFAAEVSEMLQEDFSNSRPMRAKEYKEKSFWQKFLVRAAMLTAPIQ